MGIGFDPFPHNPDIRPSDRPHDAIDEIPVVLSRRLNKLSVDLHEVDGQVQKTIDIGMTCSEVVDRDPESPALHPWRISPNLTPSISRT